MILLRRPVAIHHRIGPSPGHAAGTGSHIIVAHSGQQAGKPWAQAAQRFFRMGEEFTMADDTKVYPTGLTEREANEINEGLKWGTRIFGAIAVLAHILAFALTPWLH
jgi:light-harvesting protein B-800-850 beta chain